MTPLTRRRFLEESMLAAAAAASLPFVAPPSEAAESQPAPNSANDLLQHAIIGCRIRGRAHAASFAKVPGVQIAYVCDPDLTMAEELAATVEKLQNRRPQVVQDLRRIYDDKSVDTVSIATPNHWHALAAIWAMQAGKDVYVEKPVSHNVVEGRRIVQAARKLNRICQAGTQRRSMGAFQAAADYIREGKLGEVKLARTIIYGNRASIGPKGTCQIPPRTDLDLWLGPAHKEALTRPKLHYDWHWVWDTGNGELGNNNIHMIDVCRWLLGIDELGDSVLSIGGRLGFEDAGETPNTQITVHHFGKRTIIQEVRGLKSKPFSDKYKAGVIVYGSEGFIADSTLFDPQGNLVRKFDGKSADHFGNFIAAVRSHKPEELNAEILKGHISTALCHVANISHRVGKPTAVAEIAARLDSGEYDAEVRSTFERMVEHLKQNEVDLARSELTLGANLKIDSAHERFVGNPAADALLARDWRKPFVLPTESQL